MKKKTGLVAALTLAGSFLWSGSVLTAEAAKDTKNYAVPSDCQLVAENERLALYLQKETAAVALLDKGQNTLWWSKHAEDTDAVSITCGTPASHAVSSLSNAACTVETALDTVTVRYAFDSVGITIPVTYALDADCLTVSVETSDIQEKDAEKQCLTRLSLLRNFGTASAADEGCYVLPDGCGALVHFRSGRSMVKDYDRMVYGDNLTAAARQIQTDAEKVCFPMYGMVKNGAGLLAVCTEGDANVRLNAGCSGSGSDAAYHCGFTFVMRETDTYQLSGTASGGEMIAFERDGMRSERLAVRYYPVADTGRQGMDYADIAAAYRSYLLKETPLKATVNQAKELPLYLELYGGTEKKRSFFGIPYTRQTAVTTAQQAADFLKTLSDAGVANMRVGCYQWTEESISGQTEDALDMADCIGGKKGFRTLQQQAETMGAVLYPMVGNMQVRSGNGYYAFWDGAVRLTGETAEVYPYHLVSGSPLTAKPKGWLLSPGEFPDLTKKLCQQSVSRTLGLTDWASVLYSDHGGEGFSREQTREQVREGLAALQEHMTGGMLLENANAYALPYGDGISCVPVQSGRYDLFDEDVPLQQMILHGVCSYAVPPVNAAANADEAVLRAVACGSSLNYALIGSPVSELKQTDLQGLYYAGGAAWVRDAAEKAVWAADILSAVQGQAMTGYEVQRQRITTYYEDGTEMVTDLKEKTVSVRGKTYHLPEKEGM